MTSAQPKLPKGEITRQRILEAGETVFAELGFAAARLEDVANAVGIRRASIVYYFRNKQELYDAVEAGIFSALQAHSRSRLEAGASAMTRLQQLFDSWLEFMSARPTAARIIMRNTADITPRSSNPVEFSEGSLVDVENIVRQGQADGEFGATEPMQILTIVGASILNYVCLGSLLAEFRELLHRTLRALVQPAV
jgi:TetR/AcrR family transcriptional regulator